MQIKIFTIPIPDGERQNEELNSFLRSKRVLQTEGHIGRNAQGAYWSFCIRYLEDSVPKPGFKPKIDYKEVLDEVTFQRFSQLREIRKNLARDEGVTGYAIFTDEELAGLAKFELLTGSAMLQVKGVGEKKVERYARFFTNNSDSVANE
ncbi:MAG: HRDC domain-containing protein [Saprospiraceae bacterium]|nr:HRDC domain-containing protein [Saprospiraceae bacterium]